jgi:hypothetical protein
MRSGRASLLRRRMRRLQIQRTADPRDVLSRDVRIDLRRGETGVPEKLLDVPHVDAVLEQVRRAW